MSVMSSAVTRRTLLAMVLACVALPVSGADYGYSPRQYYGGWNKHPQHTYYYRSYYYKPYHNYGGYKHHYVVHYPSRPKYNYYYNPYRKAYWGRCPSSYGDEPTYSLLQEEHRRPQLNDIDESHFPPQGELPAIPESKDGFKIDLPPDDLPREALPPGETVE